MFDFLFWPFEVLCDMFELAGLFIRLAVKFVLAFVFTIIFVVILAVFVSCVFGG